MDQSVGLDNMQKDKNKNKNKKKMKKELSMEHSKTDQLNSVVYCRADSCCPKYCSKLGLFFL